MGQFLYGLVTATGRISRLTYFITQITVFFVAGLISAILLALGESIDNLSILFDLTSLGVILLAAYIGIVLTIKRLHDIGYGGINVIWIFALNIGTTLFEKVNSTVSLLFALVSFVVALWLLFAPGTPGDNLYGSNPLSK